jgi:hypothetical protein
MSFSSKNARRSVLPTALVALSCSFAPLQQIAAAPTDVIVPSITVQASNSAAQTAADEFLTGFIATAVRLQGPNFISCVATAATLRPDLAGKIVVCALNIARLNSHLPGGRLSCATIGQIIKAAVTAAPESAASIVKAAIGSEPYARSCIVAAAVAAAPGQEVEINAAANEAQPISILPTAGRFNPKDNAPFENVNSPEQPPPGP